MPYNIGRYTNTDAEETRPAWEVEDVEDDNKRLSVTLTADYARLMAREYRTEEHEFGRTATSVEIDVLILTEYLGYLRDDLKTKGEGTTEIPTFEDEYEHRLVRIRWQEDGRLTLEFEEHTTILVTLSKDMGESLADLLDCQLEELAAVEAAKVRIMKSFEEWQRIAEASPTWYESLINEQINYRGYMAGDEVTVVFTDQDQADEVLEVTKVEVAATVDQWQAVIDTLRQDRDENAALTVEEALEGHRYGASPIGAVELELDWNFAPEVEAILWRLSAFGVREEALCG